jgi:Na+-translocating ferredoxin:NAD+ oxidoreductase RNF subunit RnfB
MNGILWAIIWFAALGLGLGLILAAAGKLFAAEPDSRIELIEGILPSANCGGCGYAGCHALAAAIVKGEAKAAECPVAGKEIWWKIADIMDDHPVHENIRYRAQVMCSGTNDFARLKYHYDGIEDCIAANRLAGGDKACLNGCLGLGTCMSNCKFDAIKIINGVAAVDYEKCTACGACASACPKMIIKLIPFDATHWVGCMSNDRGAVTKKNCDVGCVACKLCEKSCPTAAIKITDYNATIDYAKCTGCGKCEQSCPRRVIWSNLSQKHEGIVRDRGAVGDVEN